ncbi:MAG: tetratricopeptide repeat protein, partial [Gammaproteobacteria bacterium]
MRLFVSVLCFLVAPVFAQGNYHGAEIYPPTDLAASLSKWRNMAEEGQAKAQYYLGICYEYGRGVRQDDAEAVRWYGKASAQGFPAAQYRLGVMYDYGWGVPTNDTEAVKWYSKAAQQGHPFALDDLAFMYVDGTGVEQDYVQAYMWLFVAVSNGNKLMATLFRCFAIS